MDIRWYQPITAEMETLQDADVICSDIIFKIYLWKKMLLGLQPSVCDDVIAISVHKKSSYVVNNISQQKYTL